MIDKQINHISNFPQSLLIIEILGLDQLASSMGFYAVFQGITAAVSYPLSGALNDWTGTYTSVFYLTGVAYYVAAIFLIILKLKLKRKLNNDISKIS